MVHNTARMHFGEVSNRIEMSNDQPNEKQVGMERSLLFGSILRH